jgi:hypothetical protein
VTIPTTKQSAVEAMGVLLTATAPAETLRVSESGRVYRAHAAVVMFSRAHSAFLQLIGKAGKAGEPADRMAKARQAVQMTLARDVGLMSNAAGAADKKLLDDLLTKISVPRGETSQVAWRTRLSAEIARLHGSEDTKALASALEKLEQFSRPVNAPLLRHMRPHLEGGANIPASLKAALQSHLVNGLGLSAGKARNASENIHWAMTNFGCDFREAFDIACRAGDMVQQKQCKGQHDPAMLLALICVRHGRSVEQANAVLDKFDRLIAEAMPKGWPDEWEPLPDGSRRLVNVDDFRQSYLSFLRDSLNEGRIDPASGLSTTFLRDAGRTHFRFGTGPDAVQTDLNRDQAVAALTEFAPDPAIRASLSRCLSQGGQNGCKGSMARSLATNDTPFFYILELEPDADSNPGAGLSTSAISVQLTDDEKIRVGYATYMKHFRLEHPATGALMKINSRHDSRTPASATDHTAVARAVVEFGVEQLRQGIIDPVFVRDPELRLTIEPDRPRIFLKVIDSLLV